MTPTQIAEETFIIHDHQALDHSLGDLAGVMHLDSMVIRGAQPVVVDTGVAANRERFIDDLFGIVAPNDVRWLFLSHDDADHVGNALDVLQACPNAEVISTWIGVQRLGAAGIEIPADRCHWMDDGDVLDTGDRALVLQRPPLYDAPGTLGLLDASTGVYWAVDSCAAFVPEPTVDVEALDPEVWRDGFVRFHQWNSPWVDAVDVGWWQRTINRLQERNLQVIASAHGPALHGRQVAAGLELLRELPAISPTPAPRRSPSAWPHSSPLQALHDGRWGAQDASGVVYDEAAQQHR